jgi:hypothetical protein
LEHAEVDAPGADGIVVLVGHDAGELMEVGEVVDGPGGEKLREGDDAECGMGTATAEVVWLEIQGLEGDEIFFAKEGKLIEELLERFALRLSLLSEAVEAIEWARFSVLENDPGTRHPVGALSDDEMADDVVGAPGVFSFVAANPGVGETAKECVEGCGGTGEKCEGLGQVEFRWACHDSMMLSRDEGFLNFFGR